MPNEQKMGLYLSANNIIQNPGYLEALREQIGLNLVIIGFCGEISPEVQALTPYDGLPPSDECMRSLVCQHIDGTPTTDHFDSAQHAVGPTIPAEGHDKEMREAIRRAHDVGLEVWLLGEAWTADGWNDLMYCPSQERINRWYEAVFTDIASNYDVEGLDITHVRFPMTSHPRGLFLCSCENCAQAAAEMGYDMPQMIADIYDALERLKRTDAGRLVEIAKCAMGLFDFMQLLGMKLGIIQWFKFRSELIAAKFARFRDAVHATAGNDFIFGADTYPASLSMFAGHDHALWADFSDFASPLIAHADIFQLGTIVVWAQFLQRILPALSEADALQIVYRFTGYDGLDMPTAIDDFALGDITKGFSQNHDCEFRNVPLKDLLMLDMAKARLYLPKGIPSYPIIQGGGFPHDWPRDLIQEVISGAEQLGHQGIILQGTRSLVDFELKDTAFW